MNDLYKIRGLRFAVSVLLTVSLFSRQLTMAQAVTTKTQKNVLVQASGKFTLINAGNRTLKKYATGYGEGSHNNHGGIQTNVEKIVSRTGRTASNISLTLSTYLYLPKNYKTRGDFSNPQSLVLLGDYAYVLYSTNERKNYGFIVRYDIAALKRLGCTSSKLDLLREAVYVTNLNPGYAGYASYTKNDYDKVMKCISVGPSFYTGHGMSFTYSRKDDAFYMLISPAQRADRSYTVLERISKSTLKPDKKYRYKMRINGKVLSPNNLTFDDNGNFYSFSVTGKSQNCPAGAMKIYKGTIRKDKVSVVSVKRAVRKSITTGIQSAGFSSYSKRIYFVGNGGLMSIPVSKIRGGIQGTATFTASDIRYVTFTTNREFEALDFDAKGRMHIIMNKSPEIFVSAKGRY